MEYIKGPWKIGPHNNPKIGCVDIGDTGYVVCCLKDDAQLIAAAPDMYEACLSALGLLAVENPGELPKMTEMVKSALIKAINKAEGRTI